MSIPRPPKPEPIGYTVVVALQAEPGQPVEVEVFGQFTKKEDAEHFASECHEHGVPNMTAGRAAPDDVMYAMVQPVYPATLDAIDYFYDCA